jgi:hypothetical protein
MSKVFLDDGSIINLIFASMLQAMNRSMTNLWVSDTTFHGIVPRKSVLLLGKISLGVYFGRLENLRRENIKFEVVDWPSQYHAILIQPAFARFMDVPHYAYHKLKMLGPKGMIIVHGSFTRSNNCDRDFGKIYKSFCLQEELVQLKEKTDFTLLPVTNKNRTRHGV